MPEDVQTQSTTVVPPVAADTASAPPAPDANRQEIYTKYEQRYGQDAQQPTTPTEPPVTPPTPPAPDYSATIAQLQSELAELKKNQPTPPTPPATEKPDWLKLLAEGKKDEGEAALAALLKTSMGQEIKQQAVADALAQFSAERQMNDFVTEIRSKNSDILPMEQYIANAVQIRMNAQSEKIKSPADYVTVYKEAVNAEVENARKLLQTFRGAGKAEAQTRITQVMQAQTLSPNTVNQNREQQTQSGEPQVETASDYIAKRNALAAQGRGMAS